jgi:hypothetical protein
MKKLFLSVMIILPSTLLSQTVSNLTVSAGSPSTVTFDVEWDEADLPPLWSDTMWVFVDYNKNGKMARMELLPLSAGATLTATSSPGVGKLVEVSGNTKGAWVVGDARTNAAGSFSARVQLLTATADLYGACAYASSYPPVGEYVSSSEIVFSGTPWYEITLVHEDGNTFETIESGGTFLLPCSYTVSSFTDATGAPGIIKCLEPTGLSLTASPETICAGESATLTASATGAVAYSLNGTDWQPETDFNETPLSTTAYTIYAQTEAGCSVSVANAAVVTVGQPGADGEPSTCGCAEGTTDCSGTCITTGTYTTNDGACAGCHIAYVRQWDQCGTMINAKYDTYASTCTTPYSYTNDGACAGCQIAYRRQYDACGTLISSYAGTYPNPDCTDATWNNPYVDFWVYQTTSSTEAQCRAWCIQKSCGYTSWWYQFYSNICQCKICCDGDELK